MFFAYVSLVPALTRAREERGSETRSLTRALEQGLFSVPKLTRALERGLRAAAASSSSLARVSATRVVSRVF